MSESSTLANGTGRALSEPKEPILITQAGIQLTSVEQVWRMATLLQQSGLTPSSFKNTQQVVVALLHAIELGLPVMQALNGLAVVNGRLGISGDLGLAMAEAKGQVADTKIEYSGEGENLSCSLTIQRVGREPKTQTFSVKEAKQARIYERNPVWRQYTKRMLRYRCLGFLLRDTFPDVMKGLRTVEELQDFPNEEPRGRRAKAVQQVEPEVEEQDVAATFQENGNGVRPLDTVRRLLKESGLSESDFVGVLKIAKLPT